MSTGGAAMKAMMNTEVAVNNVGIINTPNQPMYKRFSVLVIHSQKRAHRLAFSRRCKIAVIINFKSKKDFSPKIKKILICYLIVFHFFIYFTSKLFLVT